MNMVTAVNALGNADGSGAVGGVAATAAKALTPLASRIAEAMTSPQWAAGSEEEEEGHAVQYNSNMHENLKSGPLEAADIGAMSTVPSAGASSAQIRRFIQQYVHRPGEDDILLRDLAAMQDKILHALRAAGMLHDAATGSDNGGANEDNGRVHCTARGGDRTHGEQSRSPFDFKPYEKPARTTTTLPSPDQASDSFRASQGMQSGESIDYATKAGTAAARTQPKAKSPHDPGTLRTPTQEPTMSPITTTNTIKHLTSDVDRQRENLRMAHEINAQEANCSHTPH